MVEIKTLIKIQYISISYIFASFKKYKCHLNGYTMCYTNNILLFDEILQ